MTKTSTRGGSKSLAPTSSALPGSLRRSLQIAAAMLFVALVTLAAHWPVTRAQAVLFDDNEYVTDNPLVKDPSWHSVGRFFAEVLEPSTVSGYYQPLSMVSLMTDYAFGARPNALRVFHLTSLALHAINTGLIFLLVLLLFRRVFAAAAVALAFGLHPMTVEPIAWVAERKTLLAACFSLASLICYVARATALSREPFAMSCNQLSLGPDSNRRFTANGSRLRANGLLAACLVLYVLALLSKPTATPLPLAMLLLDLWPLDRFGRRAIFEKLPFFVLAGVSSIVTVVSQGRTAGIVAPHEYPATALPLLLCHNIVFYPLKLLWPAGLTAYYPFPRPLALSQPMVLAGVIGTGILIVLLIGSLRWNRAWTVGVLIFFVLLAPTMGVIGFTPVIAADRFTYLPMVGLLILLAWGFSRRTPASHANEKKAHAEAQSTQKEAGVAIVVRRYGLAVLVVVACFAEAAQTRLYLDTWRDSERLFRHMLAYAPQTAVVYRGLGNELKKKGNIDEAVDAFQRAIDLGNDHVAHSNLAVLLAARGQVDDAIYHSEQAVRAQPKWPTGYNNLGNALLQKGRLAEAASAFEKAIQLRPNYAQAHSNLGMVFAGQGDYAKAVEQYRQALALKPDMANTQHNWGDSALQQGDAEQAIAHFREALRLNPRLAASWIGLGDAQRLARKWSEAINSYQEAMRADPANTEAKRKYDELLLQ